VSSERRATSYIVERHYAPDLDRQATALLVLLARRAVDEAAAADLVDGAPPPVPRRKEVLAD
jgi:hypothetical protein